MGTVDLLQEARAARRAYRRVRDAAFACLFLTAVLAGIAGLLTLLVTVLVDAAPWLDWQFISSYPSRKPEQ
ncbi:MAG: phosphate ABC transporter, permease protein PstA, partial [Gemmatimonadetes bacterium]|nr:phosphate ABC transporter, permease protein PstA [Gemmatimonadota bacterium]